MRHLDHAPKCRCDSCCPDAPDPHATESHRHACEVRYVVALPSNEDRRRYLELVAGARGADAAERLRRDAWAVMR